MSEASASHGPYMSGGYAGLIKLSKHTSSLSTARDTQHCSCRSVDAEFGVSACLGLCVGYVDVTLVPAFANQIL